MRDNRLTPCPGCGGLVPDVGGPTHRYMQGSPGCWLVYGEVCARAYALPEGSRPAHHVDCYAVQHPGGADLDRRQRQSVAVHLVALCLLHEASLPFDRVSAARGRTSAVVLPRLDRSDWPFLPPPPGSSGDVTAADVYGATDDEAFNDLSRRWALAAWSAWAMHHATVRRWASILTEAGQ